jgi:phage baseplate assembly protein W
VAILSLIYLNPNNYYEVKTMNYAPVFPLKLDDINGYMMMDNIKDVAKFHLRNLILTSKGEKISDSNYGVGAKRYLFEMMTRGNLNLLRDEIEQQINAYLPYININRINLLPYEEQNSIQISINYGIPSLGFNDTATIDMSPASNVQTNIIF